jgi:hypothetical protein
MTWLLVKMKPSGVNTKPEPELEPFLPFRTSMLTTDELTRSEAEITAWE